MAPDAAPQKGSPKASHRLEFVDSLRGAAVLFMLEWHTADSWLRVDLRDGLSWKITVLIGGLAAPLFLLLAGTSLALRASDLADRGRPPASVTRAFIARGLEIFFLGFILRFQMWLLDSHRLTRPSSILVVLPLLGAIVLVVVGLRRAGDSLRRAVVPTFVGLALFGVALGALSFVHPSAVRRVLGIDVLQAIGASIALAAPVVVWCATHKRPLVPWIGVAIVLVGTPLLTWVLPGPLPLPLAGAIAKLNYATQIPGTSRFPVFPWLAYVFAGAALGFLWSNASRSGRLARIVLPWGAVGLGVAALTYEAFPHVYRVLHGLPELIQPIRVVHRVGITALLAALALLLTPKTRPRWAPVRAFGQASLLVYWVHMELVFGRIAEDVYRKLGWMEWAIGLGVLTAAMYGVAIVPWGVVVGVPVGMYRRLRSSSKEAIG